MKRNMCKFLIFFFIIGINIPFSSTIFNDLKSNSITYSYLCKLENNSESEKKIAKKKCLYCILENGSATDKNLSSCENITRNHDKITPIHIDPPSPRHILYFFPMNPRLKNRKTLRDIDI